MSPATPNASSRRNPPPDPGGRSRYLIRCIGIVCAALAILAVLLMLALGRATPNNVPERRQGNTGALVHWADSTHRC